MSNASERAEMPTGSQSVLDRRTVVNGNANLLKLVTRGDHVLDVGCGSGAITKDLAALVGSEGTVMGIDTSEHLIAQAQQNFAHQSNLRFAVADIMDFSSHRSFNVVTSARVLQWLASPEKVVIKLVSLLTPGGCLTVLDYNHEKIEFSPDIPERMKHFYAAFLKWRADAGMDNAIVDHLEEMFKNSGLRGVSSGDYSEVSVRGQQNFIEDISLWAKVAEVRGPQLVRDRYITEHERRQAIDDYQLWMNEEAQYMKLYLRAVTGYRD